MQELIQKIKRLSEAELQQIMHAIEKRYATDYPDWDVYYIALHKDPVLRQQQIAGITQLVRRPPEPETPNVINFPKNKRNPPSVE